MSYESPIEMFYDDMIQNLANQIRQETDDRIVCEVKMQCGVNIDKDELIKALKYDRDQYNKGYQDAMNDARAIGEWIPISERLPEQANQSYLVTVDYGDGLVCSCQRFFFGEGIGWNDDCVIAWQPLPEPYKKGE